MRRHSADHYILLFIGILILIGLIVLYSVGPALNYRLGEGVYDQNSFLYRQITSIAVALGAFYFASRLPAKSWAKLIKPLLIVSAITNVLLLIPGVGITQNGATRWIGLFGFSFQPVELLKLTLLVYFAYFLSEQLNRGRPDWKMILRNSTLILGVLGVLSVVLQRDLGSMVVLVGMMAGMLFVAGQPLIDFAKLIGGLVAAATVAVIAFPHRLERLTTFLNPGSDVQGSGYHVQQALIAIGSGGLMGLGLGKSIQSFGYVPESANDSIFAIFAEKFGFIGAVVLIGLFSLLFARIYRVAKNTSDHFSRLLVVGVFIWLVSHVIINIGAMLALMPLTGITLPLISLGGSSLLILMMGLGIVYQVSRYTDRQMSNTRGRRRQSGVSEATRRRIARGA